jgi:hypothetical protein
MLGEGWRGYRRGGDILYLSYAGGRGGGDTGGEEIYCIYPMLGGGVEGIQEGE